MVIGWRRVDNSERYRSRNRYREKAKEANKNKDIGAKGKEDR